MTMTALGFRLTANAADFTRLLQVHAERVQELVRLTGESGREHAVSFCWHHSTAGPTGSVQGSEHAVTLPPCSVGAHAMASVHTHPDEPDDPTLSLVDQQAAFFEPVEVAQAVVGRRTAEVMFSPRSPSLASLRGKLLTKGLQALVANGVITERYASDVVRHSFPLLFTRITTPNP